MTSSQTGPRHPRPGTARRARRLAAAVTAGAALAALSGGVPLLLWWLAGTPWPDHAISIDEIIASLTSPLPDVLAIKTLALLGWFYWAGFLIALGREITWYASHLSTLRHDSGGHRAHLEYLSWHRAFVAACLGTMLLGLLTTPPHVTPAADARLAAPAPPASIATAAWHPHQTAAPDSPLPTTSAAQQLPRPGITYTVAAGDSLWDIAAAKLGDPLKWPQIYGLSKHTRQPDGRYLTDPDLIYPGWTLTLPAYTGDPAPAPPPQRAAPEGPPAHQDRHGDHPPTPGGSPGAQGDSTSPHHQPTPTDRGHEATHDRSTPGPEAADRPVAVSLGEAGLIGITTAAGIAAALALFRAHQRRRHRPGHDPVELPPLAPEIATAIRAPRATASAEETDHDAGADADTPDDPDGSGLRRWTPAPPASAGTVVLGLRNGQEVPLSALNSPSALAWSGPGAPGALRALLIAALTADRSSGRAAGPIVLQESVARELFAYLPYHRRLQVAPDSLAACDLAEQHLLTRARVADERLEYADDRSTKDDAAKQGADEEQTLMLLLVHPDPRSADRLTSLAARTTPAQLRVLMLGGSPGATHWRIAPDGTPTTDGHGDPPVVDRLFHLTEQAAAEVLGLLPAPERPPQQPDTRHGQAARTTAPRATEPGPETKPSDVPDTGVAQQNVRPTGAPAATNPPRAAVPPAPARKRPPVRLEVLGRPTLRLTDSSEPIGAGLREPVHELLALLAAHPTGLHAENIADALHLQGTRTQTTEALGLMRRSVRRVLHKATAGSHADLIVINRKHHRLNPEVVATDVGDFTTALDRAAAASTDAERIQYLRQAVATYTAPFADGADYGWAEECREMLHRKAVDALARLADHLSDVDEALDLLDKAATFNPTNEAIYQRIIRLQQQAGRDDAAHRTLVLLTRRLDAIDAEPSRATLHLLGLTHPPADIAHN